MIAQHGGYYTVQGHLKSIVFVVMKSPYETFHECIILTYILSRTVCQISHSTDQIIAFDKGRGPSLLRISFQKLLTENIAVSHLDLLKLDSVDYILVANSKPIRLSSIT